MEYFVTLKDLLAELGVSYPKLYRAVILLEAEGMIAPWKSERGGYRLTLRDAGLLRQFFRILQNGKGFRDAAYILRIQLLEEENRRLEEQVGELHALVEVKPPWWERIINWWRRIRPWGKVSRSQHQYE